MSNEAFWGSASHIQQTNKHHDKFSFSRWHPKIAKLTLMTSNTMSASELANRIFSGFRSVWVRWLSWRTVMPKNLYLKTYNKKTPSAPSNYVNGICHSMWPIEINLSVVWNNLKSRQKHNQCLITTNFSLLEKMLTIILDNALHLKSREQIYWICIKKSTTNGSLTRIFLGFPHEQLRLKGF